MKLKKLLAFGLALVMCLAMAACGTNPDEKTDAEPVSITVTENWDFSVGFYPVITPILPTRFPSAALLCAVRARLLAAEWFLHRSYP